MSASKKIIRDRFAPWYYQTEAAQLNDLSRDGWQLSARRIWRMEFTYDPGVEYRYAIDYRHSHDEARYLDTFREMGWELVSTIDDAMPSLVNAYAWGFTPGTNAAEGRWYFFRRPYDPAQPEEAYLIDPDPETIAMNRRRLASASTARMWVWAAGTVICAFLLWLALRLGAEPDFALFMPLLLALAVTVVSFFERRRILTGNPTHKTRFQLWYILAAWFCIMGLSILVYFGRFALAVRAAGGLPPAVYLIPAALALLTAAVLYLPWRKGHRLLPLGRDAVVLPLMVFIVAILFTGFILLDRQETKAPDAADIVSLTEIFEALTPDMTPEALEDLLAGRDELIYSASDRAQWPENASSALIYTISVPNRIYDNGYRTYAADHDGASVTVAFDGGKLVSSLLTMKSRSRSAQCLLTPAMDSGIQVTTKSAWYSAQKTEYALSPAQAVAIAAAAVYPG